MTNEEKAMEIVSGFDAIGMLVEMAGWKDKQYSQDEAYNRGIHDACQQFKEYLEKKAEEDDRFTRIGNTIRREFINEIINELFGGE